MNGRRRRQPVSSLPKVVQAIVGFLLASAVFVLAFALVVYFS